MLPSFASEVIIRERPTHSTDVLGNVVAGWSAPNVLQISGCSIQPGSSDDELFKRDGVRVQWTVFAPVDADVQFGDRVKVRSTPFRVVGEPQAWASPVGGLAHKVIFLAAWEG